MDKIEIIERIGYIRNNAGLTQKALSYAIEMNPSYINRLESRKDFLPSLEVLMNIIEVCGSTPEEFFYHDVSAYRKDKQLFERLKTLTPNQIDILLKYDEEIMGAFNTLNKMSVKLSPEDLERAKKITCKR